MRAGGLCRTILASFGGVIAAAQALTSAGCGDPPLCQTQVFVAFEPLSISADVDAVAPGVQTDVHLRTSLLEGDRVTLEVFDEAERRLDSQTTIVGADGSASFPRIMVSSPRVVLRAAGGGLCGEARAELAADVTVGERCALQLSPEPESIAYYAPRGVLGARGDLDTETPGFQTNVRVTTQPGWSVEIYRITDSEESLGVLAADTHGALQLPVTLPDGNVGVRATCRLADRTLASSTTTLLVDATPPRCDVVTPAPGTAITPASDDNRDLTDGIQLAIALRATGADVAGEPVELTITGEQPGSVTVRPSGIDDSGTSRARVTLAPTATPAHYDLSWTTRDHAGNACQSTVGYDVVYKGCDINLTSPRTIKLDADADPANGAQLDARLALSPDCAGRTLASTCGLNSPTAVVDRDGNATLRIDVCKTSPCEAEPICRFHTTSPLGIPSELSATFVFNNIP